MSFSFHHIGMAVFSIEQTKPIYLMMGYSASQTTYDPIQNVSICFLNKEGETMIELIEPKDDQSPVNSILHKSGVSPYHNCYEVDVPLETAISELKMQKFMVVKKPECAVAIDNKRVCFLYNKNIGLIELLER